MKMADINPPLCPVRYVSFAQHWIETTMHKTGTYQNLETKRTWRCYYHNLQSSFHQIFSRSCDSYRPRSVAMRGQVMYYTYCL
jgi:hypothetical protein